MLTKKGKITIFREDLEEDKDNSQKNKKILKKEKPEPHRQKKKHTQQQAQKVVIQQEESEESVESSEEKVEISEEQQFDEEQQFGRPSTKGGPKIAHLAICFPDAILQVPQTSALRAYFISELARITSIFKVDEIVILKDHGYTQKSEKFIPSDYIARNLQYLDTPQYLRKYLFKMHPDLNNVGLMNPVEALHHLKADEKSEFREGVALERPTKAGCGSWVDIGLKQQARMDHLVLPLTRVTLRIKNYEDEFASIFQAEAVSRSSPRSQKGLYWGYDVRVAQNMKEVVEGYDVLLLNNHTKQNYGLPEVKDERVFDQQRVMIYFSGNEDLQAQIAKDDKPKLTFQQTKNKFNFSTQLGATGVKQLRLEERMILTLSRFVSLTR